MAIQTSAVGRASAVLTTGEVFGADLDLRASLDGKVAVAFSFTIGSLTSATVNVYAGATANPTTPLVVNGVVQTESLTGSIDKTYVFDCAGARYFRISVTGVGTVTSSLCEYTYEINDYETTSKQDGNVRVG